MKYLVAGSIFAVSIISFLFIRQLIPRSLENVLVVFIIALAVWLFSQIKSEEKKEDATAEKNENDDDTDKEAQQFLITSVGFVVFVCIGAYCLTSFYDG